MRCGGCKASGFSRNPETSCAQDRHDARRQSPEVETWADARRQAVDEPDEA